jgi:hypothetical protein
VLRIELLCVSTLTGVDPSREFSLTGCAGGNTKGGPSLGRGSRVCDRHLNRSSARRTGPLLAHGAALHCASLRFLLRANQLVAPATHHARGRAA